MNPLEFLKNIKTTILALMEKVLDEQIIVKLNLELFAKYTQSDDAETNEIKSFNTENQVADISCDLDEIYDEMCQNINTKSQDFEDVKSNWSLQTISHLEVNINKYDPIKGSSFIELPTDIKNKKACVNIKNDDEYCFAWAIMAAICEPNPSKDPSSTDAYPHYSERLNLENIDIPMRLKDIARFEKQNNMSVNVYGLECDTQQFKHTIIGPLHFTKNRRRTHVNLLYFEKNDKSHYCLIKNLGALLNKQHSSHHNKSWVCDGCLLFFRDEMKFRQHVQNDCNEKKTIVPEPDTCTEFLNHKNKMRVPFTIYADIESILKPIDHALPNPDVSSTTATHIHQAASFAYYIKCEYDDKLSKFVLFRNPRNPNCMEVFVRSIRNDCKRIYNNYLKHIVPMKFGPAEEKLFKETKTCFVCEKGFASEQDKRRDHCHVSGAYRAALHNSCNLNFQVPDFIPIFFHNLSGYDSHLFIKELAKFPEDEITAIPKNKESYISFTQKMDVGFKNNKPAYLKLRFLDSFKFMASSIEKLAGGLKPEQFREMRRIFKNESDFQLLTRKGVFPYEYIDSHEKFNDTVLPAKEKFFSHLTNKNISDEDYRHAQKVWSHFNINNLGAYSDLYLKTDVLLLTDIFENFRDICLKTYGLDPCNYYTAPGLSWDAMLKMTKVQIENLCDVDMIHFIKKGIRGGISQCSNRHGKANNKYIPDYDSNKESNYLLYLDANNLYGWAMSQLLPLNGFRWLTQAEIDRLNVTQKFNENKNIGYFLECDIDYPHSLHDLHNDFPFCPQNITPPNGKFSKLIPNLNNKTKYIIHSSNLMQCMRNGLILKKIHRAIQFNQTDWLKPYIELNTRMRKNATSDFEKDFFKLMNNSIYGKTMENVEKRVDVKLITRWQNDVRRQGAAYLISRLHFKSCTIFSEEFVAIQMEKLKITYDKPIYIGFSVLEISKTLMYDFHYDYIMKKFPDRAKLLYTDTDSFIYDIKTDDFYADIKPDLDTYFDTSDYPVNNQYNFPLVNKKIIGCFKDELAGKLLFEFVGLRSKMYALAIEGQVVKKAKGINKSVVEELDFSDYLFCLSTEEILYKTMYRFRSIKHILFTHCVTKNALSAHDDKRFRIDESTDTLAWGHYRIIEDEGL